MEGVSKFDVRLFCRTMPKNFVGKLFGFSEKYGFGKVLNIRLGEDITIFHREMVVSQCQNVSWEPFCVSEIFGYGEMLKIKDGACIKIFHQEFVASQY